MFVIESALKIHFVEQQRVSLAIKRILAGKFWNNYVKPLPTFLVYTFQKTLMSLQI